MIERKKSKPVAQAIPRRRFGGWIRKYAPIVSLLLMVSLVIFERKIINDDIALKSAAFKIPVLCERQRMYIQRLALLTLGFLESKTETKVFSLQIEELVSSLENGHLYLTRGDPDKGVPVWNTERVQRFLYEPPYNLHFRVARFIREIRSIAANSANGASHMNHLLWETTALTHDLGLLSEAFRADADAGLEKLEALDSLLMAGLGSSLLAFLLSLAIQDIKNLPLVGRFARAIAAVSTRVSGAFPKKSAGPGLGT